MDWGHGHLFTRLRRTVSIVRLLCSQIVQLGGTTNSKRLIKNCMNDPITITTRTRVNIFRTKSCTSCSWNRLYICIPIIFTILCTYRLLMELLIAKLSESCKTILPRKIKLKRINEILKIQCLLKIPQLQRAYSGM